MDRESVLVVAADEQEVTLKVTGPLIDSFWCTTTVRRDKDIEERLPPYWDVIPKTGRSKVPTAVLSVDALRLAKVSKVREATGKRTAALCIYVPEGSLDAIVCCVDGDKRWIAVVMPMRSEETESAQEAAE
jgi:hypothetical protein